MVGLILTRGAGGSSVSAEMKASRRLFLLVAAFLPAAAAISGLEQPWIGEPAPPFSLSTLDGNTLSLMDLKGKLVVLHFGAGW